ncbi:AraC family transcriptional regulator [Nocardia wallacei]|uniref:AraC family transcriptional regulator n=1 Tax=Nocardia wallacei TaxID=480035 RepID=UPI002453FDC5|nr:helix-turn-helix transcriptional regulator [Nocardia wallacei]
MAAPTLARRHPGGSRIERHRHPEHQLVFTSCGAVEVRTDAGCWIAPGDRAIWIPAGCWHEHHFYGPTRFHCVAFTDGLDERTRPSVLTVSPLVRELIIACSTEPDLPAAEAQRLHRVLLDRLRRSPEQPLRLPAARDPRLRRACALVERDLTVGWTLGALGREVGAAERTLTRLFRAEFAMTFPQWRTQLRLHRATQLLAEQVAVTAVAHRCGWSSPSAFIDVYRRTLGHTPGTYRSAPNAVVSTAG